MAVGVAILAGNIGFCSSPPIYPTRACDWHDSPREISQDKWEELSRLYNHPNDVEPFPGGLAEAPEPGAVVGPTFACIIGRQFRRLRFGDRFFFTHRDQGRTL